MSQCVLLHIFVHVMFKKQNVNVIKSAMAGVTPRPPGVPVLWSSFVSVHRVSNGAQTFLPVLGRKKSLVDRSSFFTRGMLFAPYPPREMHVDMWHPGKPIYPINPAGRGRISNSSGFWSHPCHTPRWGIPCGTTLSCLSPFYTIKVGTPARVRQHPSVTCLGSFAAVISLARCDRSDP